MSGEGPAVLQSLVVRITVTHEPGHSALPSRHQVLQGGVLTPALHLLPPPVRRGDGAVPPVGRGPVGLAIKKGPISRALELIHHPELFRPEEK